MQEVHDLVRDLAGFEPVGRAVPACDRGEGTVQQVHRDSKVDCAGVSAVAVIGVPDPKWGEAVTAFIAARPGEHVDPEEISKTVRAQKGSHQTPKAIHIVDELPKTAAGKIDKKALRRPYWPGGTRQIH